MDRCQPGEEGREEEGCARRNSMCKVPVVQRNLNLAQKEKRIKGSGLCHKAGEVVSDLFSPNIGGLYVQGGSGAPHLYLLS
jgi:hypothetical protein